MKNNFLISFLSFFALSMEASNCSFDAARESFEPYQYFHPNLYPELGKFFARYRCPQKIEQHLLYNVPRYIQNDVLKYGDYYVKLNIERIINAVRIQNYLKIKNLKHMGVAKKYLDKNLRIVACPVSGCNGQEKQMIKKFIARVNHNMIEPALTLDKIIGRLPETERNAVMKSLGVTKKEFMEIKAKKQEDKLKFDLAELPKLELVELPKDEQNKLLADKIKSCEHWKKNFLLNKICKSAYLYYRVDNIGYKPTSETEADFCNFIKDTSYTDCHEDNFLFDSKTKKIMVIDTETRSIQMLNGTIHDLHIKKYDDPDINIEKMLQERRKYTEHSIFDRYLRKVSSSLFLE